MAKNAVPRHVAIVMDGNGRWAKQRNESRTQGHVAGYETLRNVVESATQMGIKVLSVFAFSTENWRRPEDEVDSLMSLFLQALENEVDSLKKNNVRLRFIGDLSAFHSELKNKIIDAEKSTAQNTGLNFVIAVNYGGRWDIVQACKKLVDKAQNGQLCSDDVNESILAESLSTAAIGDPDLFIRTSGEVRISNFFLWQLAYSECYFTDKLWPDFDEHELAKAVACYQQRNRRFGDVTCLKDGEC